MRSFAHLWNFCGRVKHTEWDFEGLNGGLPTKVAAWFDCGECDKLEVSENAIIVHGVGQGKLFTKLMKVYIDRSVRNFCVFYFIYPISKP